MARINVDDDVEGRNEYRKLLKLLGGDDDRALGMLIRFWRLAQKYWGEGKLVPLEEVQAWDFQPILDSRWGLIREDGVYAIGSEERFAWYRQVLEAASAGGKARANAPRDEKGRILPESSRTPAEHHPPGGFLPAGHQPESSPLTLSPVPAPAPVPALVLKKESENTRAKESDLKTEIEEASAVYRETLRHFKQARALLESERLAIGRAIQANGVGAVKLALLGPRTEPRSEKFNPADWVDLNRYLDSKNFKRFLGYGVKASGANTRGPEGNVTRPRAWSPAWDIVDATILPDDEGPGAA